MGLRARMMPRRASRSKCQVNHRRFGRAAREANSRQSAPAVVVQPELAWEHAPPRSRRRVGAAFDLEL